MKKYISIRIVSAEPQANERQTGKYPPGSKGMHVWHEDGYNSWVPVNVFSKHYKKLDTFNGKKMGFGFALELLKNGQKLCRKAWGQRYCWIDEKDRQKGTVPDSLMMCEYIGRQWITIKSGLTVEDLFSTDWMVYNDEPDTTHTSA